ncbi:AraC-like ligand-binding domain-containing protein [Sphaerisporangium rufum]|uniref:AraC-like ligand-binding domain-containing protein n=1 Tax=Sphaerisporangium rufum TaxID=1381558 RepID=UPI00194E8097|nr:helix-turn-helix domain-containing protein [Sphaerisporangium rufum]
MLSQTIRLDDLPADERFAFWWEAVGRSVVSVDARSRHADHFTAEMRMVDLGLVQVSRVRCSPFEARRTRQRIRRSESGLYQLSIALDGRSGLRQDGHAATLVPGDMVLYDTSRPFLAWSTDGTGRDDPGALTDGLVLQFPHELLPVPAALLERRLVRPLPAATGVGALLSGLLRQSLDQAESLSAADGMRLSGIVLDLLAAVLTHEEDRPLMIDGGRQALILRIKAYIEDHLGDPGLTPARIAAAHHISTRHLQKLFQEQGAGPAGWIRCRRLERCRRDLADPAHDHLPVRTIAARWAFPSESHFTRAFRDAYDIPPAAYRRRLRAAGPRPAARRLTG